MLSVKHLRDGLSNVRILVAEDDSDLGHALKKGLEASSYAVDLVDDGEHALAVALAVPYDLIILDILLPTLDGFGVCSQIRDTGRTIPILMLTALGQVHDRVHGLDLGADDYLTKPFALSELLARVRALVRRQSQARTTQLHFQDIVLDTRTREARRGARLLELTAKEYAILELLMLYPGQVLTRSMITDHVWDLGVQHFSNVIDVLIRFLRRKLCEIGEPDVIRTVRGVGYQLKEPKE